MRKKLLAVDLDDTLAASIEGTLAHVSKVLGIEMTRGNIQDVAYWAQYGIDDSEAIRLVQDYNELGFPGLAPIPGAVEAIERLRDSYKIYVVTARDHKILKITETWLEKYFPGAIEDLVLVGNPYISTETKPKEVVCRELGADWLIDDSQKHAEAVSEQGIDSILYGGHDWNVDVKPRDHLYIAHNWEEVEKILNYA